MTKLKKGPELFALIGTLHAEGKTAAEAAAILGLQVDTVNGHRKLLGLPRFRRVPGPCRDAAIRRLHAERKTLAEAAAVLGLSQRTVDDHRRRLGLKPFSTLARQQFDALLRRLHWEGKTCAEAAAVLGRCVNVVNAHRVRLGLPWFERPQRVRCTRGDGWSDAEIAVLTQAIAAGESVDAAAQRIGRSVDAIQMKRRRLGLARFPVPDRMPRPSWPEARVAALARERHGGRSFSEGARRLGVSRSAAISAAHRYLKETA